MTTCKHCGGSGAEPDPVEDAYQRLIQRVGDAEIIVGLKDKLRLGALELRQAAMDEQDRASGRLLTLEMALREVLSHFGPANALQGSHQIFQCPNEDVGRWRKILGDEPTAARPAMTWRGAHAEQECLIGRDWTGVPVTGLQARLTGFDRMIETAHAVVEFREEP